MFDREHDRIYLVGRRNGERYYEEYPATYVMYYDDPRGKFRSIYGTPVSRFSTRSNREFRKEQRMQSGKQLYEADINPVFRCLEENYKGSDAPRLHTAFFDIEVGFDAVRGFSPPSDPFNPITAISVYLDWLDQLITLAVPPHGMSWDTAQDIAREFDNCFVFQSEGELLNMFFDIIEDADVLSGWNSEGYDIPYTVMRTTRVLSRDDTRRLCLWNQMPRQRTFERFGAEHITFDLVGRVHLDYMQLYRKYTYEERHSYSLDAIGEYEELGSKTAYEGTLDQLYNNDFRKFLEYNRQDVRLLARIDRKLRFLDLANTLAHENTVLLPTTMGAVAVTEQAIINEAHERGMVVPVRKAVSGDDTQAAGAYVATPKRGMHDYVGSIDINSLYPSTIRALNMGPETIVAQLRPIKTDQVIQERMTRQKMSFAAAWEGLFATLEYTAVMEQQAATEITVDWEGGESTTHTAAEVWRMVFDSNQPWMLSANGTIFTYEREGVVPGLLKRWYAERKEMQAKLREATDKAQEEYWDKRQLVKKINLNSLYGAILNPGCRFFDKRIGQSTTLTGRSIARHMDAYVNECITGRYDHAGDAIIYGDTDSVAKESTVRVNQLGSVVDMSIEDLFNCGTVFWEDGGKEYSRNDKLQVAHYSPGNQSVDFEDYNYVYRHKVSKHRFRITTATGKTVDLTEDHSIMVLCNGVLVERKPADLQVGDRVITISNNNKVANPNIDTISAIEELPPFDNEYVYDIGVKSDDPYFFANDVLVHNSCYFSAWPAVQADVEAHRMEWNRDIAVQLYNSIADQVNTSFPAFMEQAFHCPRDMGSVIRGGREIVAIKGLFITKKRYAVLYYDKENRRVDVDGKSGKIKVMGLDLKRSDTPKIIQEFLSEVLADVLNGVDRNAVISKIRQFKEQFHDRPGWEKGTPKRVNNLTMYSEQERRQGRANMPGHVRAALNWNRLRSINSDNYSMQIVDGMKVIVCKLRDNPLGWTSIAYPTDEAHLPEWFRELPFDHAAMETTVIDGKISNLLGVLNWDLEASTNTTSTFQDLFSFE